MPCILVWETEWKSIKFEYNFKISMLLQTYFIIKRVNCLENIIIFS